MRNVLQIVQRKPLPPDRLEWSIGVIDRQVRHMTRLVDDLLEISRITQGKIDLRKSRLELIALVQACAEAARPLMQSTGHDFTLVLPAGRIYVSADETRLSQVINNLLNNAAKFTPKGGTVRIRVAQSDDRVLISIRDSGIGLAAEHLTKVFEMFSQVDAARERSQGGLGIGLALAHALVHLHGGTLTATSEGAGKGSEFIVALPAASSEVDRTDSPAGELPSENRPARRVLVVDDNDDAAQSLAMLLRIRGHEVASASSGHDALALAAAWVPDLVILDIGLPDINGYDIARRLRSDASTAGATLVALTGWSQSHDRQSAFDAGFDRHCTKPLSSEDLETILTLTHRSG